jgi:raffinose/stachyose/melibiose transport system permease protein
MANSRSSVFPYPTVKRRRHRAVWYRRVLVPWLFILPILLLHLLVVAYPSLSGVYYAMTDWSGMGKATFVGFENFRRLFTDDPDFLGALKNNFIWLAFFLTVPFALALFAASLLAQVKRGALFYRLVLFIPYILPSVVTASIWRNLLSPKNGVGAQLAQAGIPGLDIAFLGRSDTALLSIAFVDNWHYWGFLMVLFLTAMQAIPLDLYDAAKIDGANRWQLMRYVTLPGIRPTILFMLMMTAIWSFLVFEYIWILTQGGPAGSSEVLGTLVYKQAFNNFEAGYAAAIGLTMSAFAGGIILIFIILRRLGWEV